MKIFLIAGKGSSGKNTIASFIKDYYDSKNQKTIITGFSKYIKIFAMEMGWDGSEASKPRRLLQKIGSKIREEIREDFFTHRMLEDIEFYKCFYDNIVIADVRLPFEIEYMHEMFDNVYALRVNRQTQLNNLKDEEKEHITETALDDYNRFEYVIENETDLRLLKEKIYTILDGVENNE